jgi:hypothetical protein
MKYRIHDLHASINDIYEQYDEGRITTQETNELAQKCCEQFINDLSIKEVKNVSN